MVRLLVMLLLFLPVQASAKPLVADLSSRDIRIDSRFSGTELLLFGARYEPCDIVVVVRGPARDVIVRKKDRVAGIWINREQYTLPAMPGFYSIASSRPFESIRDNGLMGPLGVGLPLTVEGEKLPEAFQQAFGRQMERRRLYARNTEEVRFMEDTLFKTSIAFPDNIPRGIYTAEVYLFSDGELTGIQTTPIAVHKTGFDAYMYDFAHRQSVLYGLVAVLMALGIGWATSRLFERL